MVLRDQALISVNEDSNVSFASDADDYKHPDAVMSQHMCVTVCTRERPQILMACLRSVLPQLESSEVETSVVVIENDGEPRNREAVLELGNKYLSVRVGYRHEPELGIPFARNTAVDTALDLGADWILFIDDDHEACDGWFDAYLAAMRDWDAEIFRGPVRYLYPDDQPAWLRMPEFDGGETGEYLKNAYTGNLAVTASVFADSQWGLRFSPKFRFTGGEDADFTHRAVERGAQVRWVREAVVCEVQAGERLAAKWFLKRAERTAAVKLMLLAQQTGTYAAWRFAAVRCPRLVLQAALKTVELPLLMIARRPLSSLMLKSRLKLSRASGYARAAIRFMPEPYAKVDDRHASD